MNFNTIQTEHFNIAEIIDKSIVIKNAQDALELLVNFQYQDIDRIIIYEENLTPNFFDLKTKIAGEILQKFSNYKGFLSIIGDFTKFNSKSLNDFILESNKMRRVTFVSSLDEAVEKLRGI